MMKKMGLCQTRLPGLQQKKEQLEKISGTCLFRRSAGWKKNCILEIRAGTGGDEASLFAGDLMRMYIKYCEGKGLEDALLSESEGTVGGIRRFR